MAERRRSPDFYDDMYDEDPYVAPSPSPYSQEWVDEQVRAELGLAYPSRPEPTTPTLNPTTPPPAGGKTPQQIEAEGRAYDAANGLIGGYMLDGVWINGSPSSGGGGGYPGTTNPYEFSYSGMEGEPDPAAFNWSQFTAPTLELAPFVSKIPGYVAPTLAEAENEPGYAFARDQGRKALESSAAGRGVLRTGGTLKDILEFGNKFGEQNYQAVDNRKFRNWGADIDREFRDYGTNRDTDVMEFDRRYKGELDTFNARRDSEKLTFQDMYNRWRARLDSLTNIATAGLQ